MNKRFALALTAILCAIAICAAMIPALSVFADGETAEDAVWIEGVTATVNDPFHVTGFFHVDYLFDGATDGLGWHATADGSLTPTVDTPTVIDADLHGTYNVWILAIYPMDFYSALWGKFAYLFLLEQRGFGLDISNRCYGFAADKANLFAIAVVLPDIYLIDLPLFRKPAIKSVLHHCRNCPLYL